MLVLSRKIGEGVVFPGSGVNITVLGIHGKRVRIGIQAPATAAVHREEVWCRISDSAESNHTDGSIEEEIVQEVLRAVNVRHGACHQKWLGSSETSSLETT